MEKIALITPNTGPNPLPGLRERGTALQGVSLYLIYTLQREGHDSIWPRVLCTRLAPPLAGGADLGPTLAFLLTTWLGIWRERPEWLGSSGPFHLVLRESIPGPAIHVGSHDTDAPMRSRVCHVYLVHQWLTLTFRLIDES